MISELEAQDISALSGSYLEPLALFGSTPKIRESAIKELARRVISTEKLRSEAGRKGGLANKGKPKAPRPGKNKGGWHQQKRNIVEAQSANNKTIDEGENKCSKCHKSKAQTSHSCPYKREMDGDDSFCDCCADCVDDCAESI